MRKHSFTTILFVRSVHIHYGHNSATQLYPVSIISLYYSTHQVECKFAGASASELSVKERNIIGN